MLDQRDVSMDYWNWLTKLLGYDFEILHKVRVENKVAGRLSRIMSDKQFTSVELFSELTVVSNMKMQEIFEDIDTHEKIRKMLKEMIYRSFEKVSYKMKGGRLFYKTCWSCNTPTNS